MSKRSILILLRFLLRLGGFGTGVAALSALGSALLGWTLPEVLVIVAAAGLNSVFSSFWLPRFSEPFYKALSAGGIFTPANKAENWAIALGWWIPRRHRADIIGDIIQDCSEMRDKGCSEWRIRIQVIWQWAIAVVSLIPAAVVGSVWRRLSPPK